jgi:biopolymer transport protein ExbD
MAAKLSGSTSGKKYTIEANADINVTPFVDIMLVLLIIFMVSIPLATVSIKLDMPPSTKEPPKDPRKPAIIRIHNDTSISLTGAEDRSTTLDGLPGDLSGVLTKVYPENKDPRENAVLVSADPEVKYEEFMDVMNKLQDSGYTKIGLVNENIK